jgi:hypothetical protein
MPGPQTQHKGVVYGDDENAQAKRYLKSTGKIVRG